MKVAAACDPLVWGWSPCGVKDFRDICNCRKPALSIEPEPWEGFLSRVRIIRRRNRLPHEDKGETSVVALPVELPQKNIL